MKHKYHEFHKICDGVTKPGMLKVQEACHPTLCHEHIGQIQVTVDEHRPHGTRHFPHTGLQSTHGIGDCVELHASIFILPRQGSKPGSDHVSPTGSRSTPQSIFGKHGPFHPVESANHPAPFSKQARACLAVHSRDRV